MPLSPTRLTLRTFHKLGLRAETVERFNHVTKRRKDLLGFIDIVALNPDSGIIGIQCTTAPNVAARRQKVLYQCTADALDWLDCGGLIEIWGWRKKGGKWEAAIHPICISDFEHENTNCLPTRSCDS